MSTPGRYDFADHTKGTFLTFPGPAIIRDTSTGPIDLTAASMFMWFRKQDATGRAILKLSTETSEILITNAENGSFNIPGVQLNMPAGLYYYDLLVVLAGEEPLTFMEGYIRIIENGAQP